jgi:hypothetical protein
VTELEWYCSVYTKLGNRHCVCVRIRFQPKVLHTLEKPWRKFVLLNVYVEVSKDTSSVVQCAGYDGAV